MKLLKVMGLLAGVVVIIQGLIYVLLSLDILTLGDNYRFVYALLNGSFLVLGVFLIMLSSKLK